MRKLVFGIYSVINFRFIAEADLRVISQGRATDAPKGIVRRIFALTTPESPGAINFLPSYL
jgi:hypothetical protein